MSSIPGSREAHDYAERIRARLPRRLQELREGCGMSMDALWMECGVSRDTTSSVEGGEKEKSMSKLPHERQRLGEWIRHLQITTAPR